MATRRIMGTCYRRLQNNERRWGKGLLGGGNSISVSYSSTNIIILSMESKCSQVTKILVMLRKIYESIKISWPALELQLELIFQTLVCLLVTSTPLEKVNGSVRRQVRCGIRKMSKELQLHLHYPHKTWLTHQGCLVLQHHHNSQKLTRSTVHSMAAYGSRLVGQ